MTELFLDYETFSEVPIKYGTAQYVRHCEPMLFQFAFDDDEPQDVDFTAGGRLPKDVTDAFRARSGPLLIAHNSYFDRNVTEHAIGIHTEVDRWRCTMVRAMMHSLPGSLDLLSDIFRLGDDAKDKDGKKLIQLFCKPMPKNQKLRRATRDTHPTEWSAFRHYGISDIRAMRRLWRSLPSWNMTAQELAYWFHDQRRNDRGMFIDVELAKAALDAVAKEQKKLKKDTIILTEGELTSTTKRDRTLEFILEQFGLDLPDLTSATIERRLADENLPEELKELLRIRLQVTTTSTSKYKSLLNGVNDDNRLRGTIQFCGAQRTGRDAGRLFQPQNLPSRNLLPQKDVELGIKALKSGHADLIFDNVMQLTSSTIRGVIMAPPGSKLCVADLANIEGRGLAWLAGEQWKLDAFVEYDEGTGPDLYNLAYAKSFSIPVEMVSKAQRQVGKVQELALGYEGGVGAFLAFALAYGMDLEQMAKDAWETLPDDIRKEAEGFYDWTVKKRRSTFGLSREAFITCDTFKRGWRQGHPMTVKLWKAAQENTKLAIMNPGETFHYRDLTFRRDKTWLRVGLPSGRFLCYPSPQLDEKGAISYMGINQYTRKWQRIHTHGGKLAENFTQAFARDVLKHGSYLAAEDGFVEVLPVHDELVTEAPDVPEYNEDRLAAAMATVPVWAPGLPLAAAGFTSYRYKKE